MTQIIRPLFRVLLPRRALNSYRRWRIRLDRAGNAKRPIRDVFREVYLKNRWGGLPGEFYSGPGSDESQAREYSQAVRKFVQERNIRSIVDVGCGDYRVGRMLRMDGVHYLGVDIVPELVELNRLSFGDFQTAFICKDLTEDDLPAGELCLVRQVLQHLSNWQIERALVRLAKYPYVLVTEHHPAPGHMTTPNRDKPHGPDTRVVDGSGVFLDLPPFSRHLEGVIIETQVDSPTAYVGETMRTFLLSSKV